MNVCEYVCVCVSVCVRACVRACYLSGVCYLSCHTGVRVLPVTCVLMLPVRCVCTNVTCVLQDDYGQCGQAEEEVLEGEVICRQPATSVAESFKLLLLRFSS